MFFILLLGLSPGCGSTSDAPADDAAQESSGDEGLPPDVEVVESEVLTEDECAERGGEIIGDPGDGQRVEDAGDQGQRAEAALHDRCRDPRR